MVHGISWLSWRGTTLSVKGYFYFYTFALCERGLNDSNATWDEFSVYKYILGEINAVWRMWNVFCGLWFWKLWCLCYVSLPVGTSRMVPVSASLVCVCVCTHTRVRAEALHV